jgi:4-hydroxy-tetrahydrodipicolinate synthase
VGAAPPYYFPLNPGELLAYYRALADELPLPLVLYNIPSCARLNLSVSLVETCSRHPNVVGLKDSSGDLDYFHDVREATAGLRDFRLLMGDESLLAEGVRLGADGGVCGGANLFPRLFAALLHATRSGDLHQVQRLEHLVAALRTTVYCLAPGGTGTIRALKAALAAQGLCGPHVAEPLAALDPAAAHRVAAAADAIQAGLAAALALPVESPALP